MEKKDLILTGRLEELCLSVFNQKLDENSEGSYVAVLTEEEECAAVEQLVDGKAEFLDFLLEYQKHYPFCNKAVDILLRHITDERVQYLLKQNFALYGFNESQGMAVCKSADVLGGDFLADFYACGRILFDDVKKQLSLIDKDLAEIYEKAVESYKKKKTQWVAD